MDKAAGLNLDGDRRGAPRRRVLKFVQIVMPDKQSVLDCGLKSLSPTGALITGQFMADVPDRYPHPGAAAPGALRGAEL